MVDSHKQISNLEISSLIEKLYTICNNCGECSLTCPPHFVGLFNPMGILRKLQMYGIEHTIKTEPLYNCITCNACMVNCPSFDPDNGMDFSQLMLLLRQYGIQNGLITPKSLPVSDCTVLYSNEEKLILSQNLKFIKGDPSLKIAKTGEYALFLGDLCKFQDKLGMKYYNWKEIAQASIKILNQIKISPVVLNMYGSGHDDYWFGNFDLVQEIAEKNCEKLSKAKVSTVICEDAESYYMWKFVYPQLVPDYNFTILHLSELLYKYNENLKKLNFDVPIPVSYTLQDVSRVGRMNKNGELYSAPRKILDSIPSLVRIEMESNRDDAFDLCCNIKLDDEKSQLSQWIRIIEEISEAKSNYFVTTSPKSIITYNKFNNQYNSEKNGGLSRPIIIDWAVFLSRFLY